MSDIVLLISSIGAIQSLFLGIYIFGLSKRVQTSTILLGLLFVVLAIRVAKSVLWAGWIETPLWIINIGFAAHAAVGPLTLLYFVQLNSNKKFQLFNLIHFVPAILILGGITGLSLNGFWYVGGYTYLLYHQLIYLVLAGLYLIFVKASGEIKPDTFQWQFHLWIGILIWGFAYFSNYILGWNSYMLGPVLYSLIIYVLSFYGFRNQHKVLSITPALRKYRNLNIGEEELNSYKKKLLKLMEEEKPYLKPGFSLSELSETTGIPSHVLSFILNDELKQNFPDLVNSYRVSHAKSLLTNPEYSNLKIAIIAYECGFNSLSSFNSAFKKQLNMTPSAYKTQTPPQTPN